MNNKLKKQISKLTREEWNFLRNINSDHIRKLKSTNYIDITSLDHLQKKLELIFDIFRTNPKLK